MAAITKKHKDINSTPATRRSLGEYYGNYTSRETGSLGGYITKRLVQIAEQSLAGSGK